VYSFLQNEKLGLHKALQFLGDVFLAQSDEHTASSLFTVALEGFVCMDVHRNRGECMLLLGDICKGNGNLPQAVEHWETARSLFDRSSQAKQMKNVSDRLASVIEQEKKLACVPELNPSETVKDTKELELDDEKSLI
jgi:hypothetical protein